MPRQITPRWQPHSMQPPSLPQTLPFPSYALQDALPVTWITSGRVVWLDSWLLGRRRTGLHRRQNIRATIGVM